MSPLSFTSPLVTLIAMVLVQVGWTPADACSCMPVHPQTMFCEYSQWVIKAKVKTNRLVDLEPTTTNRYGENHFGPPQRRLIGVKISKVFKEFPEAPEVAQGAFVRLYTAAFGSMCGSDLRVNVTYLIQGQKTNGQLTFGLCDNPTEWFRLPPLVRSGYGYLFKKNCGCKISAECQGPSCSLGCRMENSWNYKKQQCYRDNTVCVVDNSANEISTFGASSTSCKWSKRSLFYRCMSTVEDDRPFEWEP